MSFLAAAELYCLVLCEEGHRFANIFFSMSVSKIGSFFWFLLKGCFSQILTLLFCFFQIELPAVRSSFSSEGLKKPSGPL